MESSYAFFLFILMQLLLQKCLLSKEEGEGEDYPLPL